MSGDRRVDSESDRPGWRRVVTTLAGQIADLDSDLFSLIEAQSAEWDRRALLALHAAAADVCGPFAYLEIGSYRGGSLQALMRDPRCRHVMSIDLRPAGQTPDARPGAVEYQWNTTEHMLTLLRGLPHVQMGKLTTFEAGTDALRASDLPVKPDYCFIDGEHTDDAVLRDARFCARALNGTGVIAFHDCYVTSRAINTFVRENWHQISFALAFSAPARPARGGGVFALELEERGLLRHPAIDRAIGSRWHSIAWDAANRPRRTALPLLVTYATIPVIDSLIVRARAQRSR
jgi:hypothetical protein